MPRREAVLRQIDDDDRVPLQPLGRMNGGQGDGLFAARFVFRRFQRQIGDEDVESLIARGHLDDFLQRLTSARPVVGIGLFHAGPVLLHDGREDARRTEFPRPQRIQKVQIRPQAFMPGQRLAQGGRVAGNQRRMNLARRLRADTRMERRHTLKGRQIQRVDQQARIGDGILDVRGLGIAQAAVFAKGDAALIERHFQLKGVKARPEQHGDFVGTVAIEQVLDPGGHDGGLRLVAQGRDQPHRRAALLPREKMLAEGFRGVRQHAVGHVQNGFRGTIVFFQPDDARPGKKRGKIEDIADVGAAKGVDGLGLVAHRHDVAHFLRRGVGRPGQQAHDTRLHEVGILIFVHENMAKAGAQSLRGLVVAPQEGFQLEQQIVIVQQTPFPAIGCIRFSQAGQGFGMRQKLAGLTLENDVHPLFLVARLAQQTDHGLRSGKGSIPLADAERLPAFLDGGGNIRAVHQGKGAAFEPFRPPAAQHAEGKGMKRAALHADQPLIAHVRRALQHFMRRLAGKGQQQHGRGRHALIRQPGQTMHDGARLAAAGARHDQHGPVAAGRRFILGVIQSFSEIHHGIRNRLTYRKIRMRAGNGDHRRPPRRCNRKFQAYLKTSRHARKDAPPLPAGARVLTHSLRVRTLFPENAATVSRHPATRGGMQLSERTPHAQRAGTISAGSRQHS